MTNENRTRPKRLRRNTARRFHNAQLMLNCLDELNVIADYRRSEESRLLRGDLDSR